MTYSEGYVIDRLGYTSMQLKHGKIRGTVTGFVNTAIKKHSTLKHSKALKDAVFGQEKRDEIITEKKQGAALFSIAAAWLENFTPQPQAGDQGFSLLETLIALVILSLASLAMFQSSLTLTIVSQKSLSTTNEMVNKYVFQQSFRNIVQGLTPAWNESQDQAFTGQAEKFSGLTTGLSQFNGDTAMPYTTVSILPVNNTKSDIIVTTTKNTLILSSVAASDLKFTYLGWDQIWYEEWPPKIVPSTGFFDDNMFLEMPQTPVAIRLSSAVGPLSLIAARNQTDENPLRDDDLR